jgi:serine/threonine-protein kinase
MPSPKPTADAFLATVRKSGLVEPDRLQKALIDFESAGGDVQDGVAIAEFLIGRQLISKWQAEKLLQGKHKGYFLGKYRLISLLGKGGMSSVFLAEHILMRRRCAIKVLPTRRVADTSYLARFHREAQAVAALDHPNIVRAYDVDHQLERDAEIHFLVMEYVEGSSLQELITRNGPASFCDSVEYIRQAALGLEHAHKAGMVHRDIKPGNLLVDRNGTVKLLDLGLARYFTTEEGTALTIAHDEKVLGTADYLAPEQAIDSHSVDLRADLYSLGCTLYFLLTGSPPFTEGSLAQRLMAHQTKEPPLLESKRPDTPPSLASIVRKMMAKRPEDRFATAHEVADVLQTWLSENADSAWKQAHPQAFGGLKGADTKVARETVAVPAKAIPVAKPVVLATEQAEEPDTQIVARDDWPTGDLATSSAVENHPELSAFLAQVGGETQTSVSSAKATPGSPKSTVRRAATETPSKRSPPETSPNFDFLSNADTVISTPPRPGPIVVEPAQSAGVAPPADQRASTRPQSLVALETSTGVPTAAKSPASTKSLIALGIAVGVLGLAALVVFVVYPPPWFEPAKEVPIPKKLNESIRTAAWATGKITVYGDSADYPSLQEALRDAPRMFRPKLVEPKGKPDVLIITLREGTHTESVRVNGSQSPIPWPEGIVIRGEGDVILKSSDDGPVIGIEEVTGLALENLTIDAGSNPIGMKFSGYLTDCRASNVRVRGFAEAGVVLSGVHAFGGAIRLEQVRCESTSSSAVGLRIEPHVVDSLSDDSNNIVIRECRFQGPMAAGMTVQGKSPYAVEVRESLFVRTGVGVRFEGAGRWRDFAIANNTFFECGIGISFTAMPNDQSSGLSFRRNLFVKTKTAEAVVQAGYNEEKFRASLSDPTSGMDWNWSDRPDPKPPAPGEVNLFANNGRRGEAGLAFASTDPDSPQFLAPTESSPQRSGGSPLPTEKGTVGAPIK